MPTRVGTSDINNKKHTHSPTSIGESSTQKTDDVRFQPRMWKEPRMRKGPKTTPAGPPAYESDSSLSLLGQSPSPAAEEPTPSPDGLMSSSPSVPEESVEEAEVENEMDDDKYISDDRPIPPGPSDSDDDDYEVKNSSKKKAAPRARRISSSTDLGESESDEGPKMKQIGKYTAKVTRKNYFKGLGKRTSTFRS